MLAALVSLGALLTACEKEGYSAAEVEEAAKERAREKLGLSKETALVSKVFVGEPVDGETVLCGTVGGANGAAVEPQRFIVSTDATKWLVFESAEKPPAPSQPGKFVEWHTTCRGEQEA